MTIELANIDRFNITVLKLLVTLYDEFPVPKTIDSKQIGSSASEVAESINDTMGFIYHAEHVITWLAEEGFIRYEKGPPGTEFTRVRLTMNGLSILGYAPVSLQAPGKQQTLISRIKGTVASGVEKAGTEAVKGLLVELFRLAISPVAHVATTVVST